MTDKPKGPGGRPSKYVPAYATQAAKLCKLGATDMDLADFFGVNVATIYRWKEVHPEFCESLKAGKDDADERVERSLYHKAVGYTFDSVKIFQNAGQVIEAPYREHVPPSDTAAIFWLKNRRPKEWRDRQTHEHFGPDGGPIEMSITDRDRAKAMALLMTKGKGDGSS